MPIELPNLDDRRFADLTEEGRQMLFALAPSWTDHSLSDPGITMMELFAAVTEQLIYRTNRITAAHKEVFLRLVEPSGAASKRAPGIDDELARAVADMRVESRAVTVRDYERLARKAGAAGARCLPRCKPVYQNGKLEKIEENKVGHLTLVVVEHADFAGGSLISALDKELKPVLTTAPQGLKPTMADDVEHTLHIVSAQPLRVTVRMELVCFAEYRADVATMVGKPVEEVLKRYVNQRADGSTEDGPPLGQPLYKSALYALIARLPGIDYITSLSLLGADGRTSANGVRPECYEYIEIEVECIFNSSGAAP